MGRKRLFFDIEVSPNTVFTWAVGRKVNIDYNNILKERAIICICWKWEGEREVHSLNWDKKQCDKKMLLKFVEILNSADEQIGHNSDKFDTNWIRTRCLFHRIPMPPEYISIDTLKIARSKFKFNSNRLDYIGKYLGLGQKIKTDFDLWKNICLKNDQVAMDKMIKYCKQDCVLLEKVYEEMKVHIPVKFHFGRAFLQDRGNCPECGSDVLYSKKTRYTATGVKKIQYQCGTCHKFHSKTEKYG